MNVYNRKGMKVPGMVQDGGALSKMKIGGIVKGIKKVTKALSKWKKPSRAQVKKNPEKYGGLSYKYPTAKARDAFWEQYRQDVKFINKAEKKLGWFDAPAHGAMGSTTTYVKNLRKLMAKSKKK